MADRRSRPSDDVHDVLAAEEFGMGTGDPSLRANEPRDVLAAEEFVVPASDPSLRDRDAHDVLAAEEFVVPAVDPALAHGPVVLPDDPSGIEEPHDILAAEEFAMPAGRGVGSFGSEGGGRGSRAGVLLGACVVGALLLRRRLK